MVVTQQNVTPLSHRYQPLARGDNIEQKRARGKRGMFGENPGD
jgi:hypothetical protein